MRAVACGIMRGMRAIVAQSEDGTIGGEGEGGKETRRRMYDLLESALVL
jgi:hypothetical protein